MSYSWGGRNTADKDEVTTVTVLPDPLSAGGRGPDRTPVPAPGLDMARLAAELAPMVDVWRRLIAQHVPNRSGRCRTCTKGGTGLPSTPWPCLLYGIAEMARGRHDGECR